jgi:hypothetical protein
MTTTISVQDVERRLRKAKRELRAVLKAVNYTDPPDEESLRWLDSLDLAEQDRRSWQRVADRVRAGEDPIIAVLGRD